MPLAGRLQRQAATETTTAAPPPAAAATTSAAPPPAAAAAATPTNTQIQQTVDQQLTRRITELALQLEQEEARFELEQDRLELEREQQAGLAATAAETAIANQERELELAERRREIALERARLDYEERLLNTPLATAPAGPAAAAPVAARLTAAREGQIEAVHQAPAHRHTYYLRHSLESAENSKEWFRSLFRKPNARLSGTRPSSRVVYYDDLSPYRSGSVKQGTANGRPVRVYYDSLESYEDFNGRKYVAVARLPSGAGYADQYGQTEVGKVQVAPASAATGAATKESLRADVQLAAASLKSAKLEVTQA